MISDEDDGGDVGGAVLQWTIFRRRLVAIAVMFLAIPLKINGEIVV